MWDTVAALSLGTSILGILWHPLLDVLADNHIKFIIAFGANRIRVLTLCLVTGVCLVSIPLLYPC